MTGLGLMKPLRSQLGISFSSWNSRTSSNYVSRRFKKLQNGLYINWKKQNCSFCWAVSLCVCQSSVVDPVKTDKYLVRQQSDRSPSSWPACPSHRTRSTAPTQFCTEWGTEHVQNSTLGMLHHWPGDRTCSTSITNKQTNKQINMECKQRCGLESHDLSDKSK